LLFDAAKEASLPASRVRWAQIEERLSIPDANRAGLWWLAWMPGRRVLAGGAFAAGALVLLSVFVLRPAADRKYLTSAAATPAPLASRVRSIPSSSPEASLPAAALKEDYQRPATSAVSHPTEPSIALGIAKEPEIRRQRRAMLPQILRQRVRPTIERRLPDTPTPVPALNTAVVPAALARDDLDYVNPDISAEMAAPTPWPSEELRQREKEIADQVAGGDDFIFVPLPQLADRGNGAVKTALTTYAQEKAVVDPRLVRTVTLAVKGGSFAELCDRLTSETGITFTADRRVADDNVTIFCTRRPLRDIMREIGRHFSFTWRRNGTEGAYSYELTQTLNAQLLEETLRQKDRDEMLLSLDRQMEWFRPYRGMTPAQIQEKIDALTPRIKDDAQAFQEWNKLHQLRTAGLIAANQFFRLSPSEMDTLRSGRELSWNLMPPANAARPDYLPEPFALNDLIKSAFTRLDGTVMFEGQPKSLSATLKLETRPLGEYTLKAGLYRDSGGVSTALARAISPSTEKIENAMLNASLREDPALQKTVTITVKPTCELKRHPYPEFDDWQDGPRVLIADVLEAIHAATGQDIIGDQFLRLQFPEEVSVQEVRLFDALNRIGDAMQVRWTRSEGWLRFRTPDFYNARLQEVPKRLLNGWQEKRKKRKLLTLEDLVQIGSLSDTQLDSPTTAQTAIGFYGLTEWPLARAEQARPHWRFLAQLPDEQRQAAFSEKGLAFAELRPSHRHRYIELSECNTGPTLPALKDARLQILYGPTFGNYLPANNGVVFFYKFGPDYTHSAIGPFNATIRLP
jgi:hypothetical protein